MADGPSGMRLELVSIPGVDDDAAALDGLLYEPVDADVHGSVLLMHGNVGNFYSGPPRFLPPVLVRAGFSCLAFNRRGHDILVNRVGRSVEGGAFQTAEEGMQDNEAAAAFLAGRGYDHPAAVGHSNGGLLAAQFAASNPGRLSALVLLSAHAGGRETYQRSCAAGLMSGGSADALERQARELAAQGRGSQLLLMPHWWYAISASSLVDRIDRTPDLLAATATVDCPTLTIRGSKEQPGTYPMEEFASRVAGRSSVCVIEGADHWYGGFEEKVARLVAEFLVSETH